MSLCVCVCGTRANVCTCTHTYMYHTRLWVSVHMYKKIIILPSTSFYFVHNQSAILDRSLDACISP